MLLSLLLMVGMVPGQAADPCGPWSSYGSAVQGVALEVRHCRWDRANERIWFRARNQNAHDVSVEVTMYKTAVADCARPGRAETAGYLYNNRLTPSSMTKADFTIAPIGTRLVPCLKISSLGGRAPASTGNPEIRNLTLPAECMALLKSQSARLQAAGSTKKLLAWSPLILVAGETNAPHMALSILSSDWDELARGIGTVNKLVLSTLATEALVHSRNHEGQPKLEQFWQGISDSYARQIR